MRIKDRISIQTSDTSKWRRLTFFLRCKLISQIPLNGIHWLILFVFVCLAKMEIHVCKTVSGRKSFLLDGNDRLPWETRLTWLLKQTLFDFPDAFNYPKRSRFGRRSSLSPTVTLVYTAVLSAATWTLPIESLRGRKITNLLKQFAMGTMVKLQFQNLFIKCLSLQEQRLVAQ